jgi:hypothetical protein
MTICTTQNDAFAHRADVGEPTCRLRQLEPDVLRDIHKGIRAALFAVTVEAGRLDPTDEMGLAALEDEIREVARLLGDHARHEDEHVDLTLLAIELAQRVARDHALLDLRMAWIVELAAAARRVPAAGRRWAIHELYLELAAFTGAYLCHQDDEERVVVPTLFDRLGVDGVAAMHERIVGDMHPEEFRRGIVAMIPAINLDDRCELLAGMSVGMPAQVFTDVWSLAASLLAEEDVRTLAARLGR